jgi:hypothetical protein
MRNRTVVTLIVVAAAIAAAGFLAYSYYSQPTILSLLELAARQVVESPDRVDAYRIQSLRIEDGKETILKKPVRINGPIRLNGEEREELLAAVRRHGANQKKAACIPTPGIEFVFQRGSNWVRAELCFSCNNASFYDASGKHVGWSNLEHARPSFVRICKSAFPDDAAVQALPDEHGARELEGRPGDRPPGTVTARE